MLTVVLIKQFMTNNWVLFVKARWRAAGGVAGVEGVEGGAGGARGAGGAGGVKVAGGVAQVSDPLLMGLPSQVCLYTFYTSESLKTDHLIKILLFDLNIRFSPLKYKKKLSDKTLFFVDSSRVDCWILWFSGDNLSNLYYLDNLLTPLSFCFSQAPFRSKFLFVISTRPDLTMTLV